MTISSKLNVLLLQIRKPEDPMRSNEVGAFANSIDMVPSQIITADLIHSPPTKQMINNADLILIGGAGDYSVPMGGQWLERALDTMRSLYDKRKPVFASCWGFQAMAKALGGSVLADSQFAELGTIELSVTPEGSDDSVFSYLAPKFWAHVGHHDTVIELPEKAVLLASTSLVANHAFKMSDAPLYCTQFHSELTKDLLIQRLSTYPEYTEHIVGIPLNEFVLTLRETPRANHLIRRFAQHIFGT